MSWKAKYRRHRKKCAQCGAMFECYRVSQAWCSRRCAGKARAAEMPLLAQKGARAIQAKKLGDELVRLRAAGLSGGMLDAALAFGKRSYRRGHSAGTRAGVRIGWAEALGEKKGRAA